MTYEIVPYVWKQFTSIFVQEVHQNVVFAAGVSHEVQKLANNFKAILAVLNDAQAREMKEAGGRDWLNKVKDISYDMDDILDEYKTSFLKLRNEKVEKALTTKMKEYFLFYFPHLFSRIVALCAQMAARIKEINKRLDVIVKDKEMKNLSGTGLFDLKPENFKNISPSLLLNYNSLPSEMKPCFLYCAIFPKGNAINKDNLIRLWMAQGYLSVGQYKEMEKVAQEYLDKIKTPFFQEFEKDRNDNVISYKIDDTVYDFLQFLSKDEYFKLTSEGNDHEEPHLNSVNEKVCHLSLMLKNGVTVPASQFVPCTKRLRSLFVNAAEDFHGSLPSNVLSISLNKFRSLRALVFNLNLSLIEGNLEQMGNLVHLRYLKCCERNIRYLPKILFELYNLQTFDLGGCENLEKLPHGIEKLVNLRYLNLCMSNIRSLPQKLCELHNLQSLDLEGCKKLEELPQEMEKLINLRYLNLCESNIRSLPQELCELQSLQSLNLSECEKLEELPQGMGKLINLRYLNLCKLNLRSFPSMICELKNLQFSELDGCDVFKYLPEEIGKSTDLRYLNLEILWVGNYKGGTFPSNLMTSLINLRELTLFACINYKHLPPLGKLPSLESLSIERMDSVKRVGNEFLGIESDITSSSIIPFPRLKYLEFWDMDEWEKWDYEITSEREEEENVIVMPFLVSFCIVRCPKLKSLPDDLLQSTTLKHLNIYWCPILEERYGKRDRADGDKICHIPKILVNGKYVKKGYWFS